MHLVSVVPLAAKDALYRSVDRLLAHKEELFRFLQGRWQDLFGVKFEVLLYNLTGGVSSQLSL